MDVSLANFIQQVFSNPALFVTTLLTLGVIFVNGWTDAPNAIATCVTTRCMRVRSAVIMAAIFNFLGVFIMTQLNASVASTISNMVDFGGDTNAALIALCAALFSIVVYSVGASLLGIPTSESHSLIAGLSGAAALIVGVRLLQAPLIYGTVILIVSTVTVLWPWRAEFSRHYWWVWLALGGIILIVAAARYEASLKSMRTIAARIGDLR